MKTLNTRFVKIMARSSVLAICAATAQLAVAGEQGPVVDDFSDPDRNALGFERLYMDDRSTGGQTQTEYRVEDGVLFGKGEISPPRGQPGWASAVLVLAPQGEALDAAAYEGIRMRVNVKSGMLVVSANSTEITNFDYHAAPISRDPKGGYHEVKVPFDQMKRAWSEQTPLNPATIASLSLVAVGMQATSFEFEVDDVSFY